METGNNNSQGFTLLELLVVIALMSGAVVALSVTLAKSKDGLKTTALELEGVLNKARVEAMLNGRPYVFRSLDDGSGYELSSNQGVLKHKEFQDSHLSIELSASPEVIFYPNGRSNGADINLSLGDQTLNLRVDKFSGRARLQ